MADLYDKDGNLIQGAMTPQEVEAATKAASEKEVSPLKEQLTKAEEELKKLKDKDMNFANLRQTAEEKEKKITELETQINTLKGEIDAKVTAAVNTNVADEAITRLAQGDAELAKKIKLHFDTTLSGVQAKTKEELTEKLKSAYVLATKKEAAPDPLGSVISSGGANMPPRQSGAVTLTPGAEQVGAKLGLSKEDIEKYGK